MDQKSFLKSKEANKLYTEEQASALLGYAKKTLQKWRCVGGGPRYVKASQRSVRYRYSDLLDWIDIKTIESTNQDPVA